MGYYIETDGFKNKAEFIKENYKGEILPKPPKVFSDIPYDKALIVVVDNGHFEAAGFAYSEAEFKAFTRITDYRPKKYVLISRELAEELTGYI